jgi:hypothetical protein
VTHSVATIDYARLTSSFFLSISAYCYNWAHICHGPATVFTLFVCVFRQSIVGGWALAHSFSVIMLFASYSCLQAPW